MVAAFLCRQTITLLRHLAHTGSNNMTVKHVTFIFQSELYIYILTSPFLEVEPNKLGTWKHLENIPIHDH